MFRNPHEREIAVKRLVASVVFALALVLLGVQAVGAVETVVGTIDNVETDEGTAAITIMTKEGKALILQIDPADTATVKKGDQVEVIAEGKFAKRVKKL